MTVKAILTDIEGTTSSIRFVHEVLFPYASRALPDYVRDNQRNPEIAGILNAARAEANEPDASIARIIDILLVWIREDRKATPLKALQGHIWKRGYESGDLTGHVYADAADWLRRWHAMGLRLFVYSSGSVEAQKLLFGYSEAGDLRPLFEDYFDTRSGHKREADSYVNIAASIGLPANDILFLSDIPEELDAARSAGMHTCQLLRDDGIASGSHPVVASFADVKIPSD